MKRHSTLSEAILSATDDLPDGFFLVRVEQVEYRFSKGVADLCFSVVQPAEYSERRISARLPVMEQKDSWKFGWFLQEFRYDKERSQSNPKKAVVGLEGVVKIRHTRLKGMAQIRLEAFARADEWEKYAATRSSQNGPEEAAP
jgi:hypothetical protein